MLVAVVMRTKHAKELQCVDEVDAASPAQEGFDTRRYNEEKVSLLAIKHNAAIFKQNLLSQALAFLYHIFLVAGITTSRSLVDGVAMNINRNEIHHKRRKPDGNDLIP